MSDKPENPQAFPVPSWRNMMPGAPLDDPGKEILPAQAGMTLRDYIAVKAMGGLLGNPALQREMTEEELAKWSYGQADAMLVERAKKPE